MTMRLDRTTARVRRWVMMVGVASAMALLPNEAAAGTIDDSAAHDAILAQQGCFRVTFQYEELEAHQAGYELKPPTQSEVIELVTVDSASPTSIVLQHVLVTPPRIKHWKQLWRFEATEFDTYIRPDAWTRQRLSAEAVQGEWTQEVRGVADNPRYACSAAWELGDEPSWTCQTWAAKPRRDKDRDDYNILQRQNTHRIHKGGWVHEQRNTKIRLQQGVGTPVVTERGENTYDRIDPAACEDARLWWEKRRETWGAVQSAWDEVSARYETYQLDHGNGVIPLWVRLFWLARRPVAEARHEKIEARATRIIAKHLHAAPAPTTSSSDTP